jgi:hypothetical protein
LIVNHDSDINEEIVTPTEGGFMGSPKEQATHTDPQGPNSAFSPTAYEDAQTRFAEAHRKYSQAQQDSQAAAMKRYEEAYLGYVSAMQATYNDVQQRTGEAYRDHARASQEAALGDDTQKLAEQAYLGYADAVQGIQRDAQERSESAFNNFVNDQRVAQDAFRQQGMDAYRAYLKAHQDAWVQLDVEAVIKALAAGYGA